MRNTASKRPLDEEEVVSTVHRFFESQHDRGTGATYVRVIKMITEQLSQQSIPIDGEHLTDSELLVEVTRNMLVQHLGERRSKKYQMLLEGARRFTALIDEAGGTYKPKEVADLLGITEQAVRKRTGEGRLLALDHGKHSIYPVWQFSGSTVVAGFEALLKALGDLSAVSKVTFFLAGDEALGMARIDYLREHGPDPRLTAQAERMGRQGAAPG